MFRFALLLFFVAVCLGAGASEVIPFKVEEKEQKFVSDPRKFIVPLLPGHGIVVLVERELRWYGDDGAMLHRGTLRDQKQIHTARLIRYTATGFAYPNEKDEVVIVDAGGTATVLSGLAEAQLHRGVDGNLMAVSSMTAEGRVIQIVERADKWRLGEEKHRQPIASEDIVAQARPLIVVHVSSGFGAAGLPDDVSMVKDGKIIWQSGKWRFVGILPGARVALLPGNREKGLLAVVDSEGKLNELSSLGSSSMGDVILDRRREHGVIVVGDCQESEKPETYRYRSFSPDGKVVHDFSQFRTFGFPIHGSHLVFLPGRNAFVDPFNGKIVWHNQKEHYFLAKGEEPEAYFIGAQGGKAAWCFLFAGEKPFVRIRPISDEDAQQHPVSGKGKWRFAGYDGSIWLYSQTSIYRIAL